MISIIVPIYNAEKYLEECLESIRNQTFTDFEAILINDGSTDKSLEICKTYKMHDNRFHIIDNANHGVCYTRNLGLREAKGEFIAFIDADDKYDCDFLECLFYEITNKKADIAVCDFYSEKGCEHPEWKCEKINCQDIFPMYMQGAFCNRIMNKLYCRSVVEGVDFPKDRPIMEDADWTSRVLLKCRSVVVISVGKYYYRETENSLSKRKMTAIEEVGSFRNLITKFQIIAEHIPNTMFDSFTEKILEHLQWMLLANVDLEQYDTYTALRSMVQNPLFDDVHEKLFQIIRETDDSNLAIKKYYRYTLCNSKESIMKKVKYTYRQIIGINRKR